jgi:1,4-dihydroxy-2-naphthoate octaprenyltransferase
MILFCSHFHQVADDLAAGKRSPIVRLGTAKSAQLLTVAIGILFAIALFNVGLQIWPPSALLVLLSAPLGYQLSQQVQTCHDQPALVKNCKFLAVKLHFWSGVLLSLGFWLTPG